MLAGEARCTSRRAGLAGGKIAFLLRWIAHLRLLVPAEFMTVAVATPCRGSEEELRLQPVSESGSSWSLLRVLARAPERRRFLLKLLVRLWPGWCEPILCPFEREAHSFEREAH